MLSQKGKGKGGLPLPTDTFFNLPNEKRERITDLAVEEFGRHTYHRASLSRIVERAGIAKGSMYQYFVDKFDLYAYVMEVVADIKLLYIEEALAALGPGADVYQRLRAAIRAGLQMGRENPHLLSVGYNLMRETDPSIMERLMERLEHKRDIIIDWFVEAVRRGQMAAGVSPATAQYAFTAIWVQVGQDMASGRLNLDQAEAFSLEILDLLERGMRPRGKLGEEGRRER